MPQIKINLTQDQIDVLNMQVPDAKEWIINAVIGKINSSCKRLTTEFTRLNAAKLTHEEMIAELKRENVKSRKERDQEEQNKLTL